ncbi:alpha/beta hydrolase [Phyllobacterium sp. 0TCS1.6C]|uniref:alpha/beta hydrolase n=1 Tax=unclassified Phyllobacterium TaxID=2638441 RepID=UPI002264987F|nr:MULTISPECIES: alpha/beta hydrolase [unclassified Phyllobacterium]MCX8279525.1 alpha/beta hydrolase [Phyllobacterium sp. 0TCS1.6C]MCX8292284.1 alpha/beta hydrolase [Phyllobacterium sp. 0TCS1.6A]
MTTLLIPGYRGSENGHWQRQWLRDDPNAHLVEQDDWNAPTLSQWLHVLEARLAETPGAVLVAHSLGSILVAHLAGRPSAAHVAGALIVAPADVERMAAADRTFESFAPLPRQKLSFPAIVVASRDDPYMSFNKAKALSEVWGAGFVDLGNAGHINIDSGHGVWPEGHILAGSLVRPQHSGERAAA